MITDAEIIAKHDKGCRHRASLECQIVNRLLAEIKAAGPAWDKLFGPDAKKYGKKHIKSVKHQERDKASLIRRRGKSMHRFINGQGIVKNIKYNLDKKADELKEKEERELE